MIKASDAGRIVNVSSAMYAIGRLDLGKKSFIVAKNGFFRVRGIEAGNAAFYDGIGRQAGWIARYGECSPSRSSGH